MKLSDYVIQFIVQQGVRHNFEMIGGAIAHLLDSIYKREDIDCVSVHHEQAAAFAAEGYARVNGKLGVAMATSGPGALNLLTGIGSCFFDSVPCLFITGQVNTYEYKFDKPVRQIGFQETDIVSVASPLVKYAQLVAEPADIRYHLEKAVYLARSGRPGPVLLDIPMNVQRAEIEPDELAGFEGSEEFRRISEGNPPTDAEFHRIIEMIRTAERPVVLAGGGIRAGGATDEFAAFIAKTGIPVVSSLMGLDALPHDLPAFVGLIGSYGNRFGNLTLANCDLLIVLGSRLDTRQTGTRPDTFARAARKIHVDIDPLELNEKVKVDMAIHSDVRAFLQKLNAELEGRDIPRFASWHQQIEAYKSKYPASTPPQYAGGIDPNRFMELLSRYSPKGGIVCLDVGQHQMWAAQSFKLKAGQRMLNSGGMGAMGFALPAAIGAALASPESEITVIAGDGGIQVNIQELETIARHRLPIKVFVMNNRNLGMVRVFQDLYFEGRQQSTVSGYGCPDLTAIAAAYRLPVYRIDGWEAAEEAVKEAVSRSGPVFVDVRLDVETVVNPKLVVNKPIEDMSPHLDREELRGNMLIDLLQEGT